MNLNQKSCAVLDLDSTLVHTFGTLENWDFVANEPSKRIKSRLFNIKVDGVFMWGTKRPYCDEFLKACFNTFDMVGVWSAGISSYVHEIVDELFTDQRPDFILTRDECEDYHNDKTYNIVKQKPLIKLLKLYPMINPKKMIIFDDYTDVCEQNSLYHVHVPYWHGHYNSLIASDRQLLNLSNWISSKLKNVDDYKKVSIKGVFDE